MNGFWLGALVALGAYLLLNSITALLAVGSTYEITPSTWRWYFVGAVIAFGLANLVYLGVIL